MVHYTIWTYVWARNTLPQTPVSTQSSSWPQLLFFSHDKTRCKRHPLIHQVHRCQPRRTDSASLTSSAFQLSPKVIHQIGPRLGKYRTLKLPSFAVCWSHSGHLLLLSCHQILERFHTEGASLPCCWSHLKWQQGYNQPRSRSKRVVSKFDRRINSIKHRESHQTYSST